MFPIAKTSPDVDGTHRDGAPSNSNRDSDYDLLRRTLLLHTIRRDIFTVMVSWILSWVSCGICFGIDQPMCYYHHHRAYRGRDLRSRTFDRSEVRIRHHPAPGHQYAATAAAALTAVSIVQGMLSTLSGDYGIAIAAVGILSTLGVSWRRLWARGRPRERAASQRWPSSTSTCETRPTGSSGKGFAFGSAVLTLQALLAA